MTTTSSAVEQRAATYRDVFGVAEFRVLFAGFGTFLIGETVKMLALSVLVYERTGSGLLAALAYVTGFLPHALGGVFLLALADRWPPRTLIVSYDLLRLAMVAVLASGVLAPPAMLGLVAVVGLFAPVSGAARSALLPEVLHGDAYVLGRSLFTVAAGGTQVAGFAVGGLLLGLVGPYGALWLTAATCGLSALLVGAGLGDRPARARPTPPAPDPAVPVAAGPATSVTAGPAGPAPAGASGPAGAAPAGPVRAGAVRETLRVNRQLLADRRIRGLLLAQWLPGSLLVGAEAVAVPYAAGLGPGASAGVLLMAGAAGMLVGDLVVGRFVAPARRERWTPWLAVLLGVPMLAFVARPGLAAGAVLFAVATAGFAYQLGLARRFLDAVPADRRGQAFGLVSTGLMAVQGLAAAGAGAVAEVLAPGTVMALAGVASLLATLALWPVLAPRHGD
ncbi:Major Facilitator Superfamily protein [Micromonospora nigra]|uniref:Major Facilitator Superfamily protein n=1 Tax=Micromonospora nigra TaxID=145857 RepID=A0A1C6RUF1_9ACTN|nr:MFS transporter [Micromonospora nigra]SCL20851.1 Major Facilitator Superfamily protein [Micromonospora nigra]